MPRKSATAHATAAVSSSRLHPPSSLSPTEKQIFVDLVGACDASHFKESDLPLLARYAEAIALAERAAKELRVSAVTKTGKISPWLVVQEKCVRTITALSMRLRVSPQARRLIPSGKASPTVSYYEKMRRMNNGEDGDTGEAFEN